MHYSCLVITDEFPTDKVLEEKLKPFDENEYYKNWNEETDSYENLGPRPVFLWDWWQVGGRYGGICKLNADRKDDRLEEIYHWNFYEKEPRAGRLFRSAMMEKHSTGRMFEEEETYRYCGFAEGFMFVDGGLLEDIINRGELYDRSWCCIGQDGTGYARDIWDGNNWKTNEQYDDEVREVIKKADGCYACFVDIHD